MTAAGDFCIWNDLLSGGFKKIAEDLGYDFVPFKISDKTYGKLMGDSAEVYRDIAERYASGLQNGDEIIIL